ncbi:hypothetical protein Pam2_167 [Pseudanabaena phage Pam2]|nr:hypothetical protein Pam2_167 [Pseudanabaena phage Pam2]
MKNKKATFWKYLGSHPEVRNCERKDPHGFGLALISFMEYLARSGNYQRHLQDEFDIERIKVTYHTPKDAFGQEITVSAPQEVWDRAKQFQESIGYFV